MLITLTRPCAVEHAVRGQQGHHWRQVMTRVQRERRCRAAIHDALHAGYHVLHKQRTCRVAQVAVVVRVHGEAVLLHHIRHRLEQRVVQRRRQSVASVCHEAVVQVRPHRDRGVVLLQDVRHGGEQRAVLGRQELHLRA